jgi:hypothetical protein
LYKFNKQYVAAQKAGCSIELIAAITGLTTEQIAEILKKQG